MATKLETYNITRGESLAIPISINEVLDPPVDGATSQPVDLSLYDNIRADFRRGNTHHSGLLFRKELGNGLFLEGEDNNTFIIVVDKEDSLKLTSKEYYYDIAFIVGSDTKIPLEGLIKVRYNITDLEP